MMTNRAKPAALLLAVLVLVLLPIWGCNKLGDDFRTAAGPSLQTGMTAVFAGLVDGAFAVFEPGTTEDSTSSNDGSA